MLKTLFLQYSYNSLTPFYLFANKIVNISMLELLIVTLFILWVLGYVRIEGLFIPDIVFFHLNGRPITLWNVLTLAVISGIIGLLPSPFREIASVFLVIWVLAVLGIISIAGLPNILVITIVLGLVLYLFRPQPLTT